MPTISVSPTSVKQGDTVTVAGTGFDSGEAAAVRLAGVQVGTYTADDTGAFTTTFVAPAVGGPVSVDRAAVPSVALTVANPPPVQTLTLSAMVASVAGSSAIISVHATPDIINVTLAENGVKAASDAAPVNGVASWTVPGLTPGAHVFSAQGWQTPPGGGGKSSNVTSVTATIVGSTPPPPPQAGSMDAFRYGISGSAYQTDAGYQHELDECKALGFTTWRDDVGASPTRAQWIGNECHKRGLKFIACITSQDPAASKAIATQCGSKGTGVVDAYECLNEPDVGKGLATAAAYYAVAQRMCDAIRAADPTAYVIIGCKTNNTTGPEVWYGQLYAAAGNVSLRSKGFAAVSYHSYEVSWPSDTTRSGGRKMIHDVMASHGDDSMPLHITETGASIGDNTAHANALVAILQRAPGYKRADGSRYIGGTYIFTMAPRGQWPGYAILNASGGRRPAFAAMQAEVTAQRAAGIPV